LLGIIQEPTAKGLHLLRKLRNDLAHSVQLMGNDSEVSQRINKISEVLESVPNDEPKWVLHGEFTEAGNHYIFARLQGFLD